jgi:hypothetical protein
MLTRGSAKSLVDPSFGKKKKKKAKLFGKMYVPKFVVNGKKI